MECAANRALLEVTRGHLILERLRVLHLLSALRGKLVLATATRQYAAATRGILAPPRTRDGAAFSPPSAAQARPHIPPALASLVCLVVIARAIENAAAVTTLTIAAVAVAADAPAALAALVVAALPVESLLLERLRVLHLLAALVVMLTAPVIAAGKVAVSTVIPAGPPSTL